MIACEVSDLLNKHAVGGIAVSLVSSSLLVLVLSRRVPIAGLVAWWLLMLTTLGMRGGFLIHWNRQRKQFQTRNAQREITQFIQGISTTGFCWTIFPLLFFHQLDLAGRATLSTLLCGLAAGGAIILSAKEGLSVAFCAALLLPVSVLLLADGTPDSIVLGSLGVIFSA